MVTMTTHNWYFILKGHRAVHEENVLTWGRWFENTMTNNARKVGFTELGDKRKTIISTVFLGLDQRFGMGSRPILFETMAFDKKKRAEVLERYSTWGEAEKGHNKYVRIETERVRSENK